jgi:hypothetical protein
LLEVYDANVAGVTSRLTALATRAHVGTGAAVLIGGFTVIGDDQVTLLVRAVGPGLSPFAVSDLLIDPQPTLYRAGAAFAGNDNWSNSVDATAVQSAATRVGAFALAAASKDAALLVSLPAGSYTAVINGAGGAIGTALLEVYAVP